MKLCSGIALSALVLMPCLMRADEWHKRWPVAGKPELHVSAGDASVEISASDDNVVEATVITRGWAIGSAGVRITEHQSGDRVEIDIKEPGGMHIMFGEHSIRLEVRVPREQVSELHTGDGSIHLHGLHGSVRADTGDGTIQAEDLDGVLEAHTGDGSVHVRGRFDNLQLHTQDGSVEVDALRGSRVQGDWRVQTGDGSVRLSIPRDLALDLEMHTGDGHIHLDLPVTVSGQQSEHELLGKLNGGGPVLRVRTGDGSITLGAI